MTLTEYDRLSGADKLRLAVRALDGCRESFLDRFTPTELLAIHRAWVGSAWDFYPDQWTERQVREALAGRPPEWDDDERPIYEREEEPDERTVEDWKEHAE